MDEVTGDIKAELYEMFYADDILFRMECMIRIFVVIILSITIDVDYYWYDGVMLDMR